MKSFRTYDKAQRKPARSMHAVVDPAGWSPEELHDVTTWSYRLTASDRGQIKAAVDHIRKTGIAPEHVTRANFILGTLADIMCEVRLELLDGRGVVMIQNFPIDELDRLGQVIGYLGLGSHLGRPMSQNREGHILGHIKNLGGDYTDPMTRGYLTSAELRFHADGCDYVGLLCINASRAGGASRVVSSVTVYNRILERRPDIIQVLEQDFYRSHKGDINPGEIPWFKQPMFSFTDGYFNAIGPGSAIEKAQGLPGVPPLTPLQKEAIEIYRQTIEECAADIPFTCGDIQFLNNYVTLHSRRAFEDWPDPARKRHLLRLWLSDASGRPIPAAQRAGYEGKGILLAGAKLNAPLDVQQLVEGRAV